MWRNRKILAFVKTIYGWEKKTRDRLQSEQYNHVYWTNNNTQMKYVRMIFSLDQMMREKKNTNETSKVAKFLYRSADDK